MIRAIATCSSDHVYCNVLGQGAVHAAFAGFTGHFITPSHAYHIFNIRCDCWTG